MKKVFIIYSENDWNEKVPLSYGPKTREALEDWHQRGLSEGIEIYRACLDWYDENKNIFKKSWTYKNEKWIKVVAPLRPDLIFDKTANKYNYELFDLKMKISKKVKIINSPIFRTMLSNKLAQYLYFGEYMPQSFLATDENGLKKSLAKVKSNLIVTKPLYGSGGAGIVIGNKNEVKKNIEFPVLVQAFVKSRRGIPGFSKKNEISDLRLVFVNHKLMYALSRIAREGSLFTNFHQGASAVIVPQKLIPKSVQKITSAIVEKLAAFSGANYSLDFMFTDKGKPFLIEMNTSPGLDLLYIVGDKKDKKRYFDDLIKLNVEN